MYIPSKERARVIRVRLVQEFGKSNVSVKKGTGTASSWVTASVDGERPANCSCEFSTKYWNGQEAPKPFRSSRYCLLCSNEHDRLTDLVKKLSREAMESAGYKHSTYTSDDGYDTENEEFLLNINIK